MTIDATFQNEGGGICEALKCHKGWGSKLTHARSCASVDSGLSTMSALAESSPCEDLLRTGHLPYGDGFVIITADSDEGMVDIHDRRPIVLSPETAAHWLNPELSPHEAETIVAEKAEPVGAFEWHQVERGVGNVRNEGASPY